MQNQDIPFGLASKLMTLIGSLFGFITAVDFVIDGNLTPGAVTTMVLSAVAFFVLAGGRYAQAALGSVAKYLDGK